MGDRSRNLLSMTENNPWYLCETDQKTIGTMVMEGKTSGDWCAKDGERWKGDVHNFGRLFTVWVVCQYSRSFGLSPEASERSASLYLGRRQDIAWD